MKKRVLPVAVIVSIYFIAAYLLIGFKPEQVFLAAVFCVLYYLSVSTRQFILGFSIFIVYWVVFDFMKAVPNYRFNTVHLESLHAAELQLFGVVDQGVRVTPNEYWLNHTTTVLDFLSGLFYICWIPVPLLFAAWLYFKNRRQFVLFGLTFFWVNLLGFVVYYSYPAAPPWYIQQYGYVFHPHTPGSPAGLIRFDQMVHASIFQSIYAESSNVFAAMPSLHSSYPLIVLYFGLRNRFGWANLIFAAVAAGIWLSAIYTSHHYILDVLAGISCGVVGIFSFQWIYSRSPRWQHWVDSYARLITPLPRQ